MVALSNRGTDVRGGYSLQYIQAGRAYRAANWHHTTPHLACLLLCRRQGNTLALRSAYRAFRRLLVLVVWITLPHLALLPCRLLHALYAAPSLGCLALWY